jgi:ribosomal protein S18 acetylase RimI-like enzyme
MPSGPSAPPALRAAGLADLDGLTALEAACFQTDRLTRRSFRSFIDKGRATLLVADVDGRLAGYALVLYRSGTASARLYSIAVAPGARGLGLAAALLQVAEDAARQRDCIVMRLEVRADNDAAIALYRRRGYRPFGRYLDYYEDHGEALRFQKSLIASARTPDAPPYYAQTTDFTCGPAAMMMAMRALDPSIPFDRTAEFRLWREATTVFMQAGHGGCEPVGMAVALVRRGFSAEVFANQDGPFFTDSVRAPDRREAIALIQADYAAEAHDLGIPIHRTPLSPTLLQEALDTGAVVLVLVSHYRMLRSRTPHWVLVYGRAGNSVLVHDPWVERDHMETEVAASALPIPMAAFDRMSRWGRSRLRAALVVRRGDAR